MTARLALVLALATLAGACRSAPRVAAEPAAASDDAAPAAATAAEEPAEEEAAERPYEVTASLTYFALPGEDDIASPVVQVDSDWIHLEARYNYEDRDTGAMFAGANFGLGDEEGEGLRLDATLMAGAVAGQAQGVAPGYRLTLGWRFLELATEGEYLFAIGDDTESFFYSWSEATASPFDWLWLGVAAQRLRPVDSDRTLDVGPLVGVEVGIVSVAAYAMNLGDDDEFYVVSLGVSF